VSGFRHESSASPAGNGFLLQLPPNTLANLQPHLERVVLHRKDVLFRAHEPLRAVYFPLNAVISLVTVLDSGTVMEGGLVGRDGVVGVAVLPGMISMPCDAIVEIAGVAYRMDADVLRRQVETDRGLAAAFGELLTSLLARSMQMLLCNRFHAVEQRCIRRLVQLSRLSSSLEILLTHESFAAALGVRRPTVTLVFRGLQRAGLVYEQRGRVTIRDRVALETMCCECCEALAAPEPEVAIG